MGKFGGEVHTTGNADVLLLFSFISLFPNIHVTIFDTTFYLRDLT